MDKNKALELALVAWIAKIKSLPSTMRGRKYVRLNFEELFQQWKDLDGTFDELYETHLPRAIKAHLAAPSLIRNVYKDLKSKIDKTEKEFAEEWNATIEASAQDVFFEFFPATTLDKDDGPKIHGSMSEAEYRTQRRVIDQVPSLKTDELIKQWKAQKEYNLDVENTLENVLGSTDETNS